MHYLTCKKFEAAFLLIVAAAPFFRIMGQANPQVAPPNRSDTFASDERGRKSKIRVQHGELAKENFQIVGIDLASDEEVLGQGFRLLGKVQTVATGDAAASDERACYRPSDKDDTTRLYLHRGEVCPWFVLSSKSPPSEQHDFCRVSDKITKDVATASGLHLGQTKEQVISLLGLPTRRSHDVQSRKDLMAYEFETRRKASRLEMARARQQNPGMSERELESNYGFYDLGEAIEASFTDNAITELTVNLCATD